MAAPANDNFAAGQVLTGASGTVTGSNVDATLEIGEPSSSDGGFGGTDFPAEQSVWYRWVALADGDATFDTIGSTFDTVLHIYTGATLGALSLVGANDDSGGGSTSSVTFTAAAGTTYHVRVIGFEIDQVGDIVLNWVGVEPPLPYEVVVVAQDGTPAGSLANAKVTRLSFELNEAGSAEVSLATTDDDAALMVPGSEIQVFYQGGTDPIWWGPIVRPQAGLDETTWQCAGLLWYFGRRFMGRADRTDQLTNGGFESSETGWSFSGVTHSVNTDMDFVLEGTKSEKLTGATADHITYAYQIYTHGAGGYPTGDFLTGSVWVYIPSATYVGGALEDWGLMLVHKDGTGAVVDVGIATIGDDTVKNEWVALETGVANVKEGETVEVRLFPPHGDAYFDVTTLTFMESLSFGYPAPPVDVNTIIDGIVAYAQDTASGKSDLNIGYSGSTTDTARQIAYQFAEHRNILDAIQQYVRDGICDISVEVTATTRTFTVWPKTGDGRTPKLGKGTLYATTLELDVNLAAFTFSEDLEQGASSVVLLGPGDGPDRPEGGAVDTAYAGGMFTAEIVEQAPDNTTIGQLDVRAAERVAVAARPQILEVTTLPGAGVIGDLVVGDTATVVISRGWVDINDVYRVSRIDVDLDHDQATISLNPLP